MFSGIVQTRGKITAVQPSSKEGGKILAISKPDFFASVRQGDSVSVDGVCLTAVDVSPDSIQVEVMPETLRLTTLANVKEGYEPNLELSLRYGDVVGGHLVLGHIDATAKLYQKKMDGEYVRMYFEISKEFHRFLTYKGTVALNGVSLTVAEVTDRGCAVALISHTLEVTNLSKLEVGDPVNFEVDMIGRYLDRLLKG